LTKATAEDARRNIDDATLDQSECIMRVLMLKIEKPYHHSIERPEGVFTPVSGLAE
jgi:hypothetical protein